MKHLFRVLTATALLTSGWSFAEDGKNSETVVKTVGANAKEAVKNDSEKPVGTKHRLDKAEDLTPEQRVAKRKAMAAKREARITALKAKKANGKLTAEEEQQLARLELVGHHGPKTKGAKQDHEAK